MATVGCGISSWHEQLHKESVAESVFWNDIRAPSTGPAQIFHSWYVYSSVTTFTLWTDRLFSTYTPLLSSHDRAPPPHLQPFLSSCDSWFPCFDTTGHPPVIQHRLSLSTPGQNTPLRESLRQNSSRDFLVFTLLHIKLPAARNLRKLIKVIRYHFSKFTYLWISFRGVWWGVPWYSEGAGQERGSSSYQDAEAGLHRETEAGLSKRGLHHGPVLPPEHHSAGGGGDQM